ncbi:unnamed protein product [Closterium sp. Naga37s-1]|nr:unnamed protein product [Closterium sp. Naga37s-1]
MSFAIFHCMPSHVPNLQPQGDRNKARPMPSMVVTSITPRGIEGTSFLGGPAAVVPPCTLIQKLLIGGKVAEGSGKKQRTAILFFHCIPRLPGQSRLIWFFMNNIIPPWVPMPPSARGVGQEAADGNSLLPLHSPPAGAEPPHLTLSHYMIAADGLVSASPTSAPRVVRAPDKDESARHRPPFAAPHGAAAGGRGRGGAGGKELLHSHVVLLACLDLRSSLLSHLSLCLTTPCLCLQERRLEEEGGAVQGVKSYYTPTSADSFVSAYRSWLLRFAGGKARFPAYVNPELPPAKSRREILDR